MKTLTRLTLRTFIAIVLISPLIIAGGLQSTRADKPTGKEKLEIKRIHELILKGGRLYAARNYRASVEAIESAAQRLERLAKKSDSELMELLKPEHARLTLAHKLLSDAGEKPAAINDLPAPVSTEPKSTTPDQPARLTAAFPTGNETVSFGLHITPLLIENCAPCHIDTNNPRGGLNMRTFGLLLRGGDSGPPIQPGNNSNSLIIHRLNAADGADVMPPAGKLDDKIIAIFKKWIDEGAAFDGGEIGIELQTVAATAKADSQSHDELTAERLRLAKRNWKLAMSEIDADTLSTENFIIFGTSGLVELKTFGEIAENLVPKIQSTLKSNLDDPFVKGNVAIYVFEKHYDFSEFATMIEDHPLPRGVIGNWGYSTIDAYASLLLKDNREPKDVQIAIAWQLAAIKVSAMSSDVPRWFADGVGRWVAARAFPRDEIVKSWEEQANRIISNMQQPDDFLSGKLPEHQAALVAYRFVKQLRSDSGSFTKLLNLLRDGKPFEDAFLMAYGVTPQSIFARPSNNRRRGK